MSRETQAHFYVEDKHVRVDTYKV